MASTNIKVGGTWRTVSQAHVKVGGTWRQATGLWVKVGGTWYNTLGAINSSLTASSAQDAQVDPSAASCSLTVNTDGTITFTGNSVPATKNWFLPTTAGAGTGFWVMATPTVGSFSSNAMSFWTQITSNKTCSVSQSGIGGKSCTFTLQWATDSGGSNIVLTVTGNVVDAEVTP